MRKYRNGKQSREPRKLSKYSPEYIQYRENRGGYSVKVGLCDMTGDGEEDTLSVAWRNPANGKVQNCTVVINPTPIYGPTYLSASLALPTSGPASLSASLTLPTSGPASLSATAFSVVLPTSGPASLSATAFPVGSLISGVSVNDLGTDINQNKTDGNSSYQVGESVDWVGVPVTIVSEESDGTYTVILE